MSHRVRSTPDLAYARVEGTELFLDLHRPELDREVPVVACFHGGGWQRGSRKDMVSERLLPFAAQGVAVASVGYRFIDAATYPAQLHDGKAAVRWLRAHAGEFGLLGDRIGAWGASAGGWIALMLALTGGEPEFDGGVGADAGLDSSVNAAAAWFPITNLATLASERETAGLTLPPFLQGRPAPDMAAALLAVADVAEDPVTAQVASPVAHAGGAAGPILLVHGDRDGVANLRQSITLHNELTDAAKDSQLLVLTGANHEDPQFHRPPVIAATAGFFLGQG